MIKRKVLYVCVFVISFLAFGLSVSAEEAIKYKITSINISSGSGTIVVEGWAIVPNVNNYGGYSTRLEIELFDSVSRTTISKANEYSSGSFTYIDSSSYGSYNSSEGSGDYCHRRICYDVDGNEYVMPRIDPPFSEDDWRATENATVKYKHENKCVYRNMGFRATFNVGDLSNLSSETQIKINIKHRNDHDKIDVCDYDLSDRANGSNFVNSANGARTWEVGPDNGVLKSVFITKAETCSIDGNSCNGGETEFSLTSGKTGKILNSGSRFSIRISDSSPSAGEDTLEFKVSDLSLDSAGNLRINGYAMVLNQNNYGGVLSKITVIGSSASGTIEATEANGKLQYVTDSHDNLNNDAACWLRRCSPSNPGLDLSTPPQFAFTGSDSNCIKQNVGFNVTFEPDDVRMLAYGGDVTFKVKVDYVLLHDSGGYDIAGKCSTNASELSYNGALMGRLNGLGFSPVEAYPSAVRSKSASFTGNYIDNCSFDGGSCGGDDYTLNLDGREVPLEIKGYDNENVFKLSFDPSALDDLSSGSSNQHFNLTCGVSDLYKNIYSSTNKSTSLTFKITEHGGTDDPVNGVYYDTYTDSEGCVGTGSATITANYKVVQTTDLTFSINKGPIYSGGGFPFSIDVVNGVRWYYNGVVQRCPKIHVSGLWGSFCNGHDCGEDGESCCHDEGCGHGSAYIYSDDCPDDDEYAKTLYPYKIPGDVYDGSTIESGNTVTLPDDSNIVSDSTDEVGEWSCEPDDVYSAPWDQFTERVTRCKYELPEAAITRKNSDVVYGSAYQSMDDYLAKGRMYYIPLKWPSGQFPLVANLTKLSTVKDVNFSVDYTCNVEVQQRLYKLDDKGFYFFYRPIDINNPFPGNREPSANWAEWWSDSSNQSLLENSYNHLEYSVFLLPNDIRTIKQHNEYVLDNTDRLGYLNYSINNRGKSNFFGTVIGLTSSSNDHYDLGEGE